MNSIKRATFGSRMGTILVTVGSAVGLGNIWRFPYVAGEHGGGAFLLIYLGCVLFFGLPVMLSEFFVGRRTHRNAVGAYRSLDGGRKGWRLIGYNGVLAAFLIFGFYAVVAGWTLNYTLQSLGGSLTRFHSAAEYSAYFSRFISSTWPPLLCTAAMVLFTHLIIVLGVEKGIERSSKVMMPMLLLILVVLGVRSISMPGGMEGLRFLFRPDFSKVSPQTFLAAIGQAFFSISVGLGCMITYASYFGRSTDLPRTALTVTLLDTLVALLAGVVIFPAVFSVGLSPESGASLVFITLPNILGGLSLSWLWSAIFFLLLALAAVTSMISIHEVVTAYVHEEWKLPRKAAARLVSAAALGLATLCSLSYGALKAYTFGGKNLFDALDSLTADIMLPLGGIFTCIFVGWFVNSRSIGEELTNRGAVRFRLFRVFLFVLRWIAPAAISLVFLNQLGLF